MKSNVFTACAAPACKCPTIEFVDDSIVKISDDYGNTVTITTQEFDMMVEWYKTAAYESKPEG